MPSRSILRDMAGHLFGLPKQPARFIDLEHGATLHRIALKRVAGAQRFTLRVRAATGEIILTLPPHASLTAATSFAKRNVDWISARLASLKPRVPFAHGSMIPLRGDSHVVAYRPGLRTRVWVEPDGEGRFLLCVGGTTSDIDGILKRFLLVEARCDLKTAVDRHSAAVGKVVRRLTLRDTSSRWGSCSSSGTLSFSWRMILAPPFVLDYLAAHEVAHLVHMNHSDAFWSVARTLAPRLDEAEAWLKSHGPALHLYGS